MESTKNYKFQQYPLAEYCNGTRLFRILFFWIIIGLIVFSGLAILNWIKNLSCLPLSKLVVIGRIQYTTYDDIRQVILSLGPPGTFISQRIDIIQQKIKLLPWIKQVSVRKQWPYKLRINLGEFIPIMNWNHFHMLDTNGVLFSIPSVYVNKEILPMLYGPEGSEKEVMAGYFTINSILKDSYINLKAVSMTEWHSWQIVINDNIRIELGDHNGIKRLRRFIRLYPNLQQKKAQIKNYRIRYVDLRYKSGAAVCWYRVKLQDSNQQQNQPQVK